MACHDCNQCANGVFPTGFAKHLMEKVLGHEKLIQAFCDYIQNEHGRNVAKWTQVQAQKWFIGLRGSGSLSHHPLGESLNDLMCDLPDNIHRKVVLAICERTYPDWGTINNWPSPPGLIREVEIQQHPLLTSHTWDSRILAPLERSGFLIKHSVQDSWQMRIWIGHFMPYSWYSEYVAFFNMP